LGEPFSTNANVASALTRNSRSAWCAVVSGQWLAT